jgi:hypothetical protein
MSVPKCVRFTVLVKFDSRSKLTVDQDEIIISLKSRPKGGKANLELIKKLADYFGVNKGISYFRNAFMAGVQHGLNFVRHKFIPIYS